MIDVEKIKKGLECHYGGCEQADGSICPYWGQERCSNQLISDTIDLLGELLKKQEPIKPTNDVFWCLCYVCGHFVERYDNYCRNCGKAVK